MELSFAKEEIIRKYFPTLKRYGVYFDQEICDLIENCSNNLESRIQAFIGWFLSLEYRASMENKKLILPDANETFIQALEKGWYPTAFQKERLMEAGLFPFDIAMRDKLAEINFFRTISVDIPRNSNRIKFFYRGEIIWEEQISDLLKVSNRGLIEMYKFKVYRFNDN
ncbi:hypothetical protein I4641_03530 [Waterburya agarophytonicola K14]|uniref:Uncharacterized protein n=1 Tax=Waterburya agarophytonicola KI4 TaxID=2874699 RepID=A0A964BN27_9CYAN|nr:hypothetical protein [Waterburya agarophytonicola]MCC0176049.1 hypothetical protein [Waterburya agarophytonicola KI4]